MKQQTNKFTLWNLITEIYYWCVVWSVAIAGMIFMGFYYIIKFIIKTPIKFLDSIVLKEKKIIPNGYNQSYTIKELKKRQKLGY